MRAATRALSCLALVVLAIGGAASSAHADQIVDGQLFGVFATSGEFNTTQDYTVVRFMDIGGDYPNSLTPVSWPSTAAGFDPTSPDSFVPMGGEFFLMGSVDVATPAGPSEHLLLSVDGAQQGTPEGFFNDIAEPLHTDLIAGTRSLGATSPAVSVMSEGDFWNGYGGQPVKDGFFGLDLMGGFAFGGQQGPVVSLAANSYEFEGGSEDLFGYNPLGLDHDCLCEFFWSLAQVHIENEDLYNFFYGYYEYFQCSDLNDHFTGAIATGIVTPNVFTDRNGVPHPVPEPASLVLLGSSLLVGLGLRRRLSRAA